MSGKNILIIFLVSVFSLTLNAEIIKFSRLNKKKSNFSIKRDIFSAERSIRTNQAGIKRMIQPPKISVLEFGNIVSLASKYPSPKSSGFINP